MVDYSRIGLKVGLEIHRQLDTKHKLFCSCPTKLSQKKPEIVFVRRLRPTQSELGQFDPAALFEFKKGKIIVYEADRETSCLVESDEEPPHNLNLEAVKTALQAALLLNSKPVDEIHVMRKIVIDGSNTCGFQRTCIVALGGFLEVDGKRFPIQTICLEEDAARKVGEDEKRTVYRLDRLGIPLIEVATAPTISTPEEAEKVALAIGKILRSTGKVKRGIGSIRQDLNISIRDGALIEVKGVQELNLISKVVEYEVQRQLKLLEIRDELKKRGLREEELKEEFYDVTEVFRETKSGIIRRALEAGGVVLAVKLPKTAGLLKVELEPKLRFGTELSDRAVFYGGVGGIFHTDELPAYGITQTEVEKVKSILGVSGLDSAVIVADKPEKAGDALKAVVERVREALKGVPEETRSAKPDGTTRYMRPRPGAARLYPETDVPPIPISLGMVEEAKKTLPPPIDKQVEGLMGEFKINRKLAEQLLDSDYQGLFRRAVEVGVPPSFAASALTETMKSLERKGVPVENLSDEDILDVFRLIGEGKTAKESFSTLIEWMAKTGGKALEALERLGLKTLTTHEVEVVVERKLLENMDYLRQNPSRAFNHLMKVVMAEVRGRAEARVVAEVVRGCLSRHGIT
ncbi:MAG: Glu-tRNA(Gln) amidotransferase GatDE subunit E [Candidatus Hecatellales archaeon]|nr:MAG: Glu-tRNA(Gln) amidotransferase GatDE subunit E [Candidatus Hecatellales archaeon]